MKTTLIAWYAYASSHNQQTRKWLWCHVVYNLVDFLTTLFDSRHPYAHINAQPAKKSILLGKPVVDLSLGWGQQGETYRHSAETAFFLHSSTATVILCNVTNGGTMYYKRLSDAFPSKLIRKQRLRHDTNGDLQINIEFPCSRHARTSMSDRNCQELLGNVQ